MQIKKKHNLKTNMMARQQRNGSASSESGAENTHEPRGRRLGGEHNMQTMVNGLLDLGNTIWLQFERTSNYVGVDLGGYQVIDKIAQWCVHNPYSAIFMLLGFCFFIFPFLIILFFGITTVFITLFGFLVLEGTLLTIVSVILFGCIGALVLLLSFLIIIGIVFYFGYSRIYDLCDGFERQKAFLRNYMQNNMNQEVNGVHSNNNANRVQQQ